MSYEKYAAEVLAYARILIARSKGCEPEDVDDGLVESIVGIAADGDESTLDDLSSSCHSIVEEVSWHIDVLQYRQDS